MITNFRVEPSFEALIVTVTPVTPCHEQISQYWRGKHRIKSKMEIDPATQGDAGIYECHANNKSVIDLISKLIILLSYNKMDSMGGGNIYKERNIMTYFFSACPAHIYYLSRYSIDMRSFRTDYSIFVSSSALSSGY